MFSSAELIEAMRRRVPRSIRPPPPPGEFPPGWRDWFAAMAAQPGRTTGASAEAIATFVSGRLPAVTPEMVSTMGRWRAFASLWRHAPGPVGHDEAWPRIAALTATIVLHLLFAVAMVWLMLQSFWFQAPAAEARRGEEHVLQVEYIGEGTPAAGGGDTAPAPAEVPAAAPSVAPSRTAAQAAEPHPLPAPLEEEPPEPPVLPSPAPREPFVEVPELALPELSAPDDVLQVTEVDVPDSSFVLPPPRELAVNAPEAAVRDVRIRDRDITVPDPSGSAPLAAIRGPAPVEVEAAPAPQPEVPLAERRIELAADVEPRIEPLVPVAEIRPPGVHADAPAPAAREIPMPAAPAVDDAASATAPGPEAGGTAAPTPGPRADAPGARADWPAGALPSTRAGDDWGDSTRSVPGGQRGTPAASGLFDEDGRPRLAGGGHVGGGLPPGTVTEDFENVDRHGTWLKRPPYDYEPTSFDRFWMPSESLLEEWVRRSVTEVRIPIPGTTKTIRCRTILLAVGGACDILDPNLQEQSAGAREPPPVPFKPELMEDQDSLGPAPPPEP